MATRARAARLLTLDAAARLRPRRALRHGGRHGQVLRLARRRWRTASKSMRIHGAYGYSKEYDIERLYRDAPLTCIGEGTNEMQRIIIARQWIKRNAGMSMKPLAGHSHPHPRAVRRRALRHHVPGRPRRRGDQGRERRDRRRSRRARSGRIMLGDDDSEYFQAWNIDKKSVTLDLKSTEGRAAVRGAGEDRRLRGQQPARRPAGQARPRLCEPEARSSPRSSACTSRPTAATTSAPTGRATTS